MNNDSVRDLSGQALVASDGAQEVSTLTGFDPSRGGFYRDMDRAFEIALQTLRLSAAVEAGARLFYADSMNNREGHVSERVAARIIAAVFAATAALKAERNEVCRYINGCADGFSAVPVEYPEGSDRREAYFYSLDAVTRYHALADHIHDRAHLERTGA